MFEYMVLLYLVSGCSCSCTIRVCPAHLTLSCPGRDDFQVLGFCTILTWSVLIGYVGSIGLCVGQTVCSIHQHTMLQEEEEEHDDVYSVLVSSADIEPFFGALVGSKHHFHILTTLFCRFMSCLSRPFVLFDIECLLRGVCHSLPRSGAVLR